jgi:hypothetical protein
VKSVLKFLFADSGFYQLAKTTKNIDDAQKLIAFTSMIRLRSFHMRDCKKVLLRWKTFVFAMTLAATFNANAQSSDMIKLNCVGNQHVKIQLKDDGQESEHDKPWSSGIIEIDLSASDQKIHGCPGKLINNQAQWICPGSGIYSERVTVVNRATLELNESWTTDSSLGFGDYHVIAQCSIVKNQF